MASSKTLLMPQATRPNRSDCFSSDPYPTTRARSAPDNRGRPANRPSTRFLCLPLVTGGPAEAAAPTGEMAAIAGQPDVDASVGGGAIAIRDWFDEVAAAERPESDSSLAAAHDSARAYRSRAKADNTRAAYRSAVRTWCAWCDRHGVSALPATPRDVAAFLAAERDRGQAGNTLKLRAAAIRFLHRAVGLPSPTETAEVSETMAGIRRDVPNPQKKRVATLSVLRELLEPIPDDPRGLRDRTLLLVGFAGALRRSELAGIVLGDLLRTDHGYALTLKRSKGAQTHAVLVPLRYGRTELCPVRALGRWLDAAAIGDGAVFRRLWTPPQASSDGPLPRSRLARRRSPRVRSRRSFRRALRRPGPRDASSAATA